jgi:FKBP-type peptidyl-prolyl cis-trans isomerase
MGAKNGDAVRVHDTGKFEDGGVFGTSRDHPPLD